MLLQIHRRRKKIGWRKRRAGACYRGLKKVATSLRDAAGFLKDENICAVDLKIRRLFHKKKKNCV